MRRLGIGIAIGTVFALSILDSKKKLKNLVKRGKCAIKDKVEEMLD